MTFNAYIIVGIGEEGLDITTCDFVIRYDVANTVSGIYIMESMWIEQVGRWEWERKWEVE